MLARYGPSRAAVLKAAAPLGGWAITAASYALLALARTDRWDIYIAAVLLGTGIGLAFAAMVNLIIESVGPAETGIATGMNTVMRTVGGAFGGAIVASILTASVGADRYPSAHGYTVAFAVCAVAISLGVVVGLAIPQRRPADAFAPHEAGDLAEVGAEVVAP